MLRAVSSFFTWGGLFCVMIFFRSKKKAVPVPLALAAFIFFCPSFGGKDNNKSPQG